MFTTIRRFRWPQWLLAAACVAALSLAAWQIDRAIHHLAYLRQNGAPAIAGWMTVGHVAELYHVPPGVLEEALGLPPDHVERRPLQAIARQRGESMEQLQATLLAAIARSRAAGAPTPPSLPGAAPPP